MLTSPSDGCAGWQRWGVIGWSAKTEIDAGRGFHVLNKEDIGNVSLIFITEAGSNTHGMRVSVMIRTGCLLPRLSFRCHVHRRARSRRHSCQTDSGFRPRIAIQRRRSPPRCLLLRVLEPDADTTAIGWDELNSIRFQRHLYELQICRRDRRNSVIHFGAPNCRNSHAG